MIIALFSALLGGLVVMFVMMYGNIQTSKTPVTETEGISLSDQVDRALGKWYGHQIIKTSQYKAEFSSDLLQFDLRAQTFEKFDSFECSGEVLSRDLEKPTDERAERIAQKILAITGIKGVYFDYYEIRIFKSGAYDWKEFASVILSIVNAELGSEPAITPADKPEPEQNVFPSASAFHNFAPAKFFSG